jgi:uncharacterized membrane protein
MKISQITKMGLIAALYVAVTMLISPVAFGFIQFRISSILKCLVLKDRKYILGITVGVIIANLFSPYASVGKLAFMPFITIAGGEIAYRMKKRPAIALFIYGMITVGGVAFTLKIIAGIPFFLTLPSVTASETFLMLLGQKIMGRWFDVVIGVRSDNNSREIHP